MAESVISKNLPGHHRYMDTCCQHESDDQEPEGSPHAEKLLKTQNPRGSRKRSRSYTCSKICTVTWVYAQGCSTSLKPHGLGAMIG